MNYELVVYTSELPLDPKRALFKWTVPAEAMPGQLAAVLSVRPGLAAMIRIAPGPIEDLEAFAAEQAAEFPAALAGLRAMLAGGQAGELH